MASTFLEKSIALALSALLVSCGAARHTFPANAAELSRLVLIIRETPDGEVIHSWQRAKDFDLPQYRPPSSSCSVSGRIVLASSQKRDCHAEYLECHRDCKRSSLPPGYGHIPRGSVRHDSFCWEKCKQAYLDCEKLHELQPREFTAIDNAVDWLKRNRKGVLVGSLVVIAGVAFLVVSAGTGLVVLAPAVLLASSATPAEPHMARVSP